MRVREVTLSEFHLLGLTAIFMSSKIEDPRPILLDEILTHAGFGAFTRSMVLNSEVEILKTLSFRLQIQDTSPVERSYSLLLTFTLDHLSKSGMAKPGDPHAMLSSPELFPTLQFVSLAFKHRCPAIDDAVSILICSLRLILEMSAVTSDIKSMARNALKHFQAKLSCLEHLQGLIRYLEYLRIPRDSQDVPRHLYDVQEEDFT